jgi:predicted Zn-dependent protease
MAVPASNRSNCAVLAFCLLSLTGCGRNLQFYIESGNRLYDAGKYDDATIQYRKALQKDAKSGEAHYRLALVELKLEKPIQAYGELQRAVELMPDHIQALFRLGQLALTIYNADSRHPAQLYQQAAKMAALLLGKQPDGFEGNLLQGALDLVDKKPEDAVARLRGALKAKPDDATAKLGLARALVENRQTEAGLDLARQLIQQDKTFGAAYDFLYERYALAGRADQAENTLKQKVSNNPNQVAFVLELARYYVTQRRPADVSGALRRLTDSPKDFPDGPLLAGDFYASLGEPDQALPQFEAGLRTASKNKNVYRKRIVGIMASRRKWPETYSQLQACLKDQPDDQEAKLMRAVAWLDEGKRENLDPAITELKAQLAKRPQETGLHFQLGNALAQKGDADGARRQWTAAAQQKRDYLPPRFALVQMDLAQGKAQDALRVSEEIVAVAPRDEQSRLLHVTCQIGVGQFEQARAELNRLSTDFPQSGQVRFRMGVLALSEKKFSQAEQIFRQLAGVVGPDPQVYSGLAQAYAGQNELAKAIQALQDELKRTPGSVGLRQVLAQVAMSSGKYDIAIEQFKQLAAAAPASIEIQRALADAYRAQGNETAAIGILEAAVQKDPSHVAASLDLAHALLSAGRVGDAKGQYRRVLKGQPNNPNALNDLSYLIADSGENLDEALVLAQRGAQFAYEPSLKTSLSDTLGWIHLKKHMYDMAVQRFQSLVNNNPGSMTFRYQLGTTLYQIGNKTKAKAELEAALAAATKSDDEPQIRKLFGADLSVRGVAICFDFSRAEASKALL